MSGTPNSPRQRASSKRPVQERWQRVTRSRPWQWLQSRLAAQKQAQPEPSELTGWPSENGLVSEIDLSQALQDGFTEQAPQSAVESVRDMPTSTHGQAKALRRELDGRPAHKIRVWALEDLQRHPGTLPRVYTPDQLGW